MNITKQILQPVLLLLAATSLSPIAIGNDEPWEIQECRFYYSYVKGEININASNIGSIQFCAGYLNGFFQANMIEQGRATNLNFKICFPKDGNYHPEKAVIAFIDYWESPARPDYVDHSPFVLGAALEQAWKDGCKD